MVEANLDQYYTAAILSEYRDRRTWGDEKLPRSRVVEAPSCLAGKIHEAANVFQIANMGE
jgi:hypothetical protein